MNNVHKIAGPPGTGKTTRLLEICDELLGGSVSPDKLVYTTFTQAGAYEARDRAVDKFRLSEDKLPYFRTLHSICYRTLGRQDLMNWNDWINLARSLNLRFSSPSSVLYGPGEPAGGTKGDLLQNLYQLARTTQSSLRDIVCQSLDAPAFGITVPEAEHFAKSLENYKKAQGKIDYTDLLIMFLDRQPVFEIDKVIGDEMQDLSPLQWEVFKHIASQANEVWIAGDDDQALYEWAGAKADLFIDAPGDLEVLKQSYRVPKSAHQIAENISKRIRKRIPKTYAPRNFPGRVIRRDAIDALDLSEGRWMLLARNHFYLELYSQHCLRRGWPYRSSKGGAIRSEAMAAVRQWSLVCSGQTISGAEAKNLYNFLAPKTAVAWGMKTAIQNQHDEEIFNESRLREDFGLLATGTWDQALSGVTNGEKNYFRALERKGELFNEPRIEISTIHNAKGREEDNVVILPEMTKKSFDASLNNPDAEHRVWYVAVTRARENLHLLTPVSSRAYAI